jgi:modulator of FtsH protease
MRNGGQLVGLAAAGTGIIFLTLAGIATTTKKDFSFLGKFLVIGVVLVFLAIIANIFLNIPALSLTISAVFILISAGFILYEVGNIVNGGETNYVMATLSLFISIYNIFSNLLSILMSFGGND